MEWIPFAVSGIYLFLLLLSVVIVIVLIIKRLFFDNETFEKRDN